MADETRKVHTEFTAEDKFSPVVDKMTGSLGQFKQVSKETADSSQKDFKRQEKGGVSSFKKMQKGLAVAGLGVAGLATAYKVFFKGSGKSKWAGTLGGLTGMTTKAGMAKGALKGLTNTTLGLFGHLYTFAAANVWGMIFGGAALGMIYKATAAAELYQKRLKEVNFVLGSTAKQARMVDQTIVQLGIDTPFSMSESAEAVYLLASSFGEVNKTLAATPAMMDVALAGNLDLANGANLLIQTLNMFNEVNGKTRWELAETSRRQADVLTTMQRISPFVMGEFGPAFQGASRAIAAYNQELESSLAIMGALKQMNPTNPVMAGFGVDMMMRAFNMNKRAFERITGVSFLTPEGKTKQLMDLVRTLAEKLGLTQANVEVRAQEKDIQRRLKDIFPSTYQLAPFLNVIKVGMDRVKGWYTTLKTESSGAAAAFRDDMIDTVRGWKTQLRGSIGTMWALLGRTIQPFQQAMYKGMTKGVNVIINLLQLPLVKYFTMAGIAATAFAGTLVMVSKLIGAMSIQMTGLAAARGGYLAAGLGVSAITGRLGGGFLGMKLKGMLHTISVFTGMVGFETTLLRLIPLVAKFALSFGVVFFTIKALSKLFPEFGKLVTWALSRAKMIIMFVKDALVKLIGSLGKGMKEGNKWVREWLGGAFSFLGFKIDNTEKGMRKFGETLDKITKSPFFKTMSVFFKGLGFVLGIIGGFGGRIMGILVGLTMFKFFFTTFGVLLKSSVGIFGSFARTGFSLAGFMKRTVFSVGRMLTGIKATSVETRKAVVFARAKSIWWMRVKNSVAQTFGWMKKITVEGKKSFMGTRAGAGLKIGAQALMGAFKTGGIMFKNAAAAILAAITQGAEYIYSRIVAAFGMGAGAAGGKGVVMGAAGAGKGRGGPIIMGAGGKGRGRPRIPKGVKGGKGGKFLATGMGGKIGMGVMGAALISSFVPWDKIAGPGVGDTISEVTSGGFTMAMAATGGVFGLVIGLFQGLQNLIKWFGKFVKKWKAIIIGIGAAAGVIAGVILSLTGAGAAIGVPLILKSLGIGVTAAGLSAGFLGRKGVGLKDEYKNTPGSSLPAYQSGGIIMNTGLAKLHKGEIVVPKAQARGYDGEYGGKHVEVNLTVPINGHIVGELPDEFYRTIRDKINNIVGDEIDYSYA